MRILLIGKTFATAAFAQYFTQNPNNIVFSTLSGTDAESVDILPDNIQELKEFALANEMSLTLLCDKDSILSPIKEEFEKDRLRVFAPDSKTFKFLNSKIWAKKFIYKNKIPTPRFQFFEKPQAAIEYVRKNKFPIVIKPDSIGALGARICETFGSAKVAIEEFFDNGVKKILTEEYIWGKEFSVYTICDGYNPLFLCEISKYQNSFAMIGTDFLGEKEKQKIVKEVILPFFDTLTKENNAYTGILGFNFVKTKDKIFLISIVPFFEDIDSQIAINGIKASWEDIFECTLSNTLFENFSQIQQNDSHLLSYEFYENGKKTNVFAQAKTFNAARKILCEEGADKKEIEEALKHWKY